MIAAVKQAPKLEAPAGEVRSVANNKQSNWQWLIALLIVAVVSSAIAVLITVQTLGRQVSEIKKKQEEQHSIQSEFQSLREFLEERLPAPVESKQQPKPKPANRRRSPDGSRLEGLDASGMPSRVAR